MLKRLLAVAAAMVMALFAIPALGEGDYREVKAVDVEINRYSETLAIRDVDSRLYALIKPDGTRLTSDIYNSAWAMSGYPYFKVEITSADGVHDEGIVDSEGNVIVPVKYADVSVVSDRWAYGVRLTPSTADDKDYTFTNYGTDEKTFYRIDTVDFYFRGTLAGTLTRSEFDGYPQAYGDYICVTSRDKTRKYYDSGMKVSPKSGDYGEYETSYRKGTTQYLHNGSGQVAFDPACTLTAEEVDKSIVYEKGKFLNLQGGEAFKAAQNYDYFNDFVNGYAVVTMNSMRGVIDLEGREVIPLEYESIDNYNGTLGRFGAISAVKDGKFGYLDAQGSVTCAFRYSKDIVRDYGILATIKDLDGSTIVLSGLAGELPEHYADVNVTYYGRTFVAKNDQGEACLIDATGETLIPYTDVYSIEANIEGTVAVCNMGSRTYRIYTFTHDETKAAPARTGDGAETGETAETAETGETAESGTWTCSNGHEDNTGNFCPVCGEAKPSGDVTCPSCGTVYAADEVPNFCPNDGTKLK